ncbi:MAG: tetratricopeptide repeat protein [Gemmatimonadota bacterium]|nr:tetratricopeptide repeat protein [Gemmatimonadota bacterium]MDE2865839.1 tetratricopeptide repeat protein [Gemmatimonadota bacterium]
MWKTIHRSRVQPLHPLAAAWFVAAAGCFAQPAEPDPVLLEAVDWYTGVAGAVNDERARELLEEAVAGGGALAAMWMARVHSTGRMGFPQDEERARRLAGSVVRKVQRAAESGVLEAVFLMGTAYDEGLGRPVDAERAAVWHRRAAERGHVLGAHVLGNQYSEGRGVAEDPALAVEWWTRAAEEGDAITQLRLGEAYEAGRGVGQDRDRALDWYGRASRAGNQQAREALARLEAELGPPRS